VRAERKRNLKLGLKLAHEDSLPTPPPTADTEPSGTAAAAPTRREQGGNTHAARERRREKYKIKMEAQAEAAKAAERGGEATAPAPTPAPTTTTHTETTTTTTTTLDPLPGVLAAAPVPRHRRPVVNADLPPPAHEYSRHKHTGPVVLTDDLLWEPEDGKNVPAASWGLLRRARGPVEIEEEEEADNSATSESPWPQHLHVIAGSFRFGAWPALGLFAPHSFLDRFWKRVRIASGSHAFASSAPSATYVPKLAH
jgi:hypothetical protein